MKYYSDEFRIYQGLEYFYPETTIRSTKHLNIFELPCIAMR